MTDLVLHWMSFRQSGKAADLTDVLAGGTDGRRLVDSLVTLGHVERITADAWRVAPPVIAGLAPELGATAVLCGARTPALLERLEQAAEVSGAKVNRVAQENLPSVITITAAAQTALVETAKKAKLPHIADAGFKLLACTPSIREWPRTPFPMVQGKVDTVRRFSSSSMGWITSSLEEATSARKGFFRIKRDWDWVSLIKSSAAEAALIDDRAGRLAASAKSRTVGWLREGGILTLPAQLYPPSIMARGLVLCSGNIPQFNREKRQISFAGVQLGHLKLILALTGLRLL